MSIKQLFTTGLISTALLLGAHVSHAESFAEFIDGLKPELEALGISHSILVEAVGENPEVEKKVYTKLNNQPEVKFSFTKYLNRLASDSRAQTGADKFAKHKPDVLKAEELTGVPAEVITALWGIESFYGKLQGTFPTVKSLASLAYDSHRKDFFKKELIAALKIVQDGHISLGDMQGSWAGATGQCQFMPTSFQQYAMDGDGDGKKDIWTTEADVFASAGNYISKRGWNSGEAWGQRVVLGKRLPKINFDKRALSEPMPISYWKEMGLYAVKGGLPDDEDMPARLFLPQGPSKKAYLTYNNFDVVMRWNNSSYFAFSVLTLADKIKARIYSN